MINSLLESMDQTSPGPTMNFIAYRHHDNVRFHRPNKSPSYEPHLQKRAITTTIGRPATPISYNKDSPDNPKCLLRHLLPMRFFGPRGTTHIYLPLHCTQQTTIQHKNHFPILPTSKASTIVWRLVFARHIILYHLATSMTFIIAASCTSAYIFCIYTTCTHLTFT